MTVRLQTFTLRSPGGLGLNAEDIGGAEDPRWALQLDNAAWDSQGRVAARKGWNGLKTSGGPTTADIESVFEYIGSATSSEIISTGDASIFTGTGAMSDITGTLTPSNNDWAFVNFNGKCIGFQSGETMIVYTGTGNFANVVASAGTLPSGNVILSAWGRLWCSDATESTIKWSGLLDETDWNTAGSGSIDLANVWPDGLDSIVALAGWQNRLIIFGKRSILIYTGADVTPASNLALEDILTSSGAVSRDCVQAVGNDLLYLWIDGVHSLARAIEFSNLPQRLLSRSVRTRLSEDIALSLDTPSTIKSAYSAKEALYILRMGSSYWAFDARQTDQGQLRASVWFGIGWLDAHGAEDGTLYLGEPAEVGEYTGYLDDAATYQFRYLSSWQGEDIELFPKSCRAVVVTEGAYSIALRWAFDYMKDEFSDVVTLSDTRTVAEWGVGEWNIAEWSGATTQIATLNYNMAGAGSRFQFGMSVTINGSSFGIQALDVFTKTGRVAA